MNIINRAASSNFIFSCNNYSLIRNPKYRFGILKNLFSRKQSQKQDNVDSRIWRIPHPLWTKKEVKEVKITHKKPANLGDLFADWFIKCFRLGFFIMSGYKKVFPWQNKNKQKTEDDWLNRMLYLEAVAGVPGFVAAMNRHLRSLRRMEHDNGWINVHLQQAENGRIHLMTFLSVKKPSYMFRIGLVLAQFWYVGLFSVIHFLFPRVCHRIIGYIEEEAVKTYTEAIEVALKPESEIQNWCKKQAPKPSIQYWNLPPNATVLDVIYSIRKDQDNNRQINHRFADDFSQSKTTNLINEDQKMSK